MLQLIKNWMLPIAMGLGGVFYPFFGRLSFLTPYLIFSMLLVTFCKISFKNMKIHPLHVSLLLIQLVGCLLIYGIIRIVNPVVSEGALICLLAPTATSAAVITGMLGGDIAFLTTYTLFSSVGVAIAAPIIFSFLGTHQDMSFWSSFFYICKQVIPLLILPLLVAWLLQRFVPIIHRKILATRQLGFYLWAVALAIVTGKTVVFLLNQQHPDYTNEILLAVVSLVVCVGQFLTGRALGKRYKDPISAQQGLGQKNTILAIWMAQVYLTPISSIAPAAYVLWQNIINSYQLWKKRKDELGVCDK
ncbi:transporter [Parabacteroides pacaensis]|uniref:transporter n=1 Tax=Parabacteroides pacaensis TaxID=2086575 RepID=UPI000D0FA095|nr:transporter [Parabacteroides pacaensis]